MKTNHIITCEYCKEQTNINSNKRFCSHNCRAKYYYHNNEEEVKLKRKQKRLVKAKEKKEREQQEFWDKFISRWGFDNRKKDQDLTPEEKENKQKFLDYYDNL